MQSGEDQLGSQGSKQQISSGQQSSGQQSSQGSTVSGSQNSGLSEAQQQALLQHLQQLQQQRESGGQKAQSGSSNSLSNQQLQQLAKQGKLNSSSSSSSSSGSGGGSGFVPCPPGEHFAASGASGGGHEALTYGNQKDFELNGSSATLPSAVTVDWDSTIQLGPAAGVSYLGSPGEQARAAGAVKAQSGTARSQQIHPRHRETVGDFFSDD